ncbi:hypothetical protein [Siminovitchia sp. 179-K 8D1 HS]|uniref:hypothetical protein n=1 Tax=Siminovitchia sp. 179-K 8D1 HS TaxID=3142385 RepID=UPI0039A04C6F
MVRPNEHIHQWIAENTQRFPLDTGEAHPELPLSVTDASIVGIASSVRSGHAFFTND